MTAAACLVVAKAPVRGQAKTRLAQTVGDEAAAQLAAASLLDTLDVCAGTFDRCVLALSGDLTAAFAGEQIRDVLRGWTVLPQRGTGLAQRLEHAHLDAHAVCRAPIVQVGMDTPHMSPVALRRVATPLERGAADAVLGPAHDGGWWALGLAHPRWAAGLGSVQMSTPMTLRLTRCRLLGNGARVATADTVRDIDTAADADALRHRTASGRFGRAWCDISRAGRS